MVKVDTPKDYVLVLAEKIASFDEDVLNLVMPHKRYALGEALQGSSQNEIGSHLKISQPSVSYIINTTLKRCAYRQGVARPTDYDVHVGTQDLEAPDRRVMLAMFKTHANQVQAARILKRSQGYVRYRFIKSLPSVRGPLREWFELAQFIEPRWENHIDFYRGSIPKSCPDGRSLRAMALSALDNVEPNCEKRTQWVPFPWNTWKPF